MRQDDTTKQRPIRVLIVDDDPVYRLVLSKTFAALNGVEVVGVAPSLAIARSKLTLEAVDIVTIDVVLREESGLTLLPWLREHHPRVTSVLLTAGTVREASQAVDALLLGASTLVLKPGGVMAQKELSEALTRIVRGVVSGPVAKPVFVARLPLHEAREREIIAVGASTGGPPVVVQFLRDLPRSFDTPILLTQHMPALHMPYFAELVARESGKNVQLSQHGAKVERGSVYLACDDKHMRLVRRGTALHLEQIEGPQEHHCRPAVDPMFRSVAEVCGAACVGVVMTGMGADGALGAQALRSKGAPVVVQDQATSVVWGMPGATANLGAASEIVPASELARAVQRWTLSHSPREAQSA